MDRHWWTIAGVLGATAVLLGAFGAHGLADRLDAQHLAWWHTGAQYHLIHAVGLLAVAGHPERARIAGWLFLAGVALFSGSLYAMALTDVRWLGMITPLGGLSFVGGWLALAWARSRPPAGTITP